MSSVHLRKLFLTFLIPMGIYAKELKQTNYAPTVKKWRSVYYVDYFNQKYKNALTSFIAYLLQQTPSSKTFNKEFKSIYGEFPNPSRDFHLALVKVFENAFLESYKTGTCNDGSWNCMLSQCYDCMYGMLDEKHLTYNYGEQTGQPLPTPKNKNLQK